MSSVLRIKFTFLGYYMDSGVSERFTQIRYDKKLDRKEFADQLEISPTVISDIENGKREPSKELILRASIAYAISLNWIYMGVEPKSLIQAINPSNANLETRLNSIDFRLTTIERGLQELKAAIAING
jgi:transcriptional regulator with XRE-family HTH domain